MAAVCQLLPVIVFILSSSTRPITGDRGTGTFKYFSCTDILQLIAAGSSLVAMVTDTVSVKAVGPLCGLRSLPEEFGADGFKGTGWTERSGTVTSTSGGL